MFCQVEWEEKWWQSSDWAGMKELGAEKSGCRADGAAWRETWREAIGFDEGSGEPMVERTAHKWAQDASVSILFPSCYLVGSSHRVSCQQGFHITPHNAHDCQIAKLPEDLSLNHLPCSCWYAD